MPSDEITLSINGSTYGGWKATDATRSIESLCGSFNVSLMDKWYEGQMPIQIQPGDACQVMIGDEPIITGFVDSVSPAISAADHSITISGRDKTCDLVDCSAEIDTYEIIGQDLAALANLICGRFGIAVQVKTDVGEPFVRFAVQPGETAFACLERAAKQRGVLLTASEDGALVLSAKGVFEESGDALIYGKNIKSASAVFDAKDRFSEYMVNGQTPAFDDGADDPYHDQIGKARDPNVMRYRPLILTAESWTDPDAAKTRAENECCCRAGKSFRVNAQVVGWRQSSGVLWKPGLKVEVTAPPLYLENSELAVGTVRYSFSDGDGAITELELTRPDAYLDSGAGKVEEDPNDF